MRVQERVLGQRGLDGAAVMDWIQTGAARTQRGVCDAACSWLYIARDGRESGGEAVRERVGGGMRGTLWACWSVAVVAAAVVSRATGRVGDVWDGVVVDGEDEEGRELGADWRV